MLALTFCAVQIYGFVDEFLRCNNGKSKSEDNMDIDRPTRDMASDGPGATSLPREEDRGIDRSLVAEIEPWTTAYATKGDTSPAISHRVHTGTVTVARIQMAKRV